MLASALLERLNQDTGRSLHFAPAALAALSNYAWPGNVRELRNFVQRASIFNDGDLIAELPQPILTEVLGDRDVADEVVTVQLGATLAEVDRRMILSTLARCSGVKTHAAEVLDISLKTIYNRLAEFDDIENAESPDDAASP
jgi:DNA-binding NtrC family response regulator